MKFTIEGKTYELAQSKVTFAEAKAIERVTGHTFQEIRSSKDVAESIDVQQAMYWISMKRVDPTLAFSDLDDIAMDEIEFPEEPESSDPTEPVEAPEPVAAELPQVDEPTAPEA